MLLLFHSEQTYWRLCRRSKPSHRTWPSWHSCKKPKHLAAKSSCQAIIQLSTTMWMWMRKRVRRKGVCQAVSGEGRKWSAKDHLERKKTRKQTRRSISQILQLLGLGWGSSCFVKCYTRMLCSTFAVLFKSLFIYLCVCVCTCVCVCVCESCRG